MTQAALIALDWGSSNVRAYLLDHKGEIISSKQAAKGIKQLKAADYAPCLQQLIGAWLSNEPKLPLIASGMIGSRNGLYETAYLDCPCELTQLAEQLSPVSIDNKTLYLVPGCKTELKQKFDVMRGEETQVLGALKQTTAQECCICLPGTHSKWAWVNKGTLSDFSTYLTGELFTALYHHTLLGQGTIHDDDAAFLQGLITAQQNPDDMLANLFSARSQYIKQAITADQTASYLSGLLIGHELLAATQRYQAEPIYCLGDRKLSARYQQAFAYYKINVNCLEAERASVNGLYQLAKLAQLIT